MNRPTAPRIWRLGAGTRTVAITEQVATIIDVTDRELGERVWRAQLADGADGALEILLQGGMSAVPDFVLFEIEDRSFRAVIRGKAKVVSVGNDGLATYEGKDVRLAAEHLITDPISIHAGFVDTLPHLATAVSEVPGGAVDLTAMMNADCSLVSGFGMANWISAGEAAVTEDSTDRRGVDDGPMPEAAVDVIRGADAPEPRRLAESATTGAAVADTHDIGTHDIGTPDIGTPHIGTPDIETRDIGTPDIETRDRSPAEAGTHDNGFENKGGHDTDAEPPLHHLETAATGVPDADSTSDENLDDDGHRYASIFGETVQRSVMDAAIRPTADGEDGIDGGSISTAAAESLVESSDVASDREHPIERRISVDTVPSTDFVDGHTLPPVDDAGPDVDDAGPGRHDAIAIIHGDHDGHTISRADLPSVGGNRAGSEPNNPAAQFDVEASEPYVGPTVQSVRCADDHDNPPHRSECGRCHLPLDGQPITVPRPPLGTLTFSTGGEVVLDRPILVGRKPDVAGLICSEIPREVAVDVGDGLSRSHALFSIAGWQVRVEDLDSTNHTTIRLPGQPAQRLRVGESVPITDGTLIDLGGEVTCRYDVHI